VRRTAVILAVVAVLAACSARTGRREGDATLFSRREGPVTVGVDLLIDGPTQQRWLGRVVDERLFIRLVPVGVVVQNTGARPLAMRRAGSVFELHARGERTPLEPAAALTALQIAYDAIVAAGPPRADYPRAESTMIQTRALCGNTGVGCLLIPPAMLVAGIADTASHFGDRARYPSRMRDLEKAYADLRAREEHALREGDTWVSRGETGRVVFYYPMNPGYGDSLPGSVITVRLGAATGSDLIVPVTLGSPAR
jgi:hypothetical protein